MRTSGVPIPSQSNHNVVQSLANEDDDTLPEPAGTPLEFG
jgi:hypothetical protein